ncbi:TORTIFOLIA1-like protein 2 [Nymphaea colorata]|nr:TORTIFOLIA1-like protein 2 [Nymphaea colorata]XP_049937097.1 TORTIFOLIA1-like protein 2 [Nymphaea colorata]XP_049937098.1 TORTIFOLIA1-like protein 2 [Nymphaea colorata]
MPGYNMRYSKVKATGKISAQQATFELKQRIVLSLNKIADKDTYQIGKDDLEKIAESLTVDGIGPFISIIVDTDSEQKSAVRKECIRIMSLLARIHGEQLGPYIGKMVNSIVRRLKDSDSIVRDACVETVGVLASVMMQSQSVGNCPKESGATFVVFVRPLFEALGEQNKQIQSGSALCLAAVINNSTDPPVAILQRLLTRVIKLLRNQHFLAKPALLELAASLIQGGGASTAHILSTALTAIQESLKDSEWSTRKAASVALAHIAINCGPSLISFKASCIASLESCQFDKVKPVRDIVVQTLQYWRSIRNADSPDFSEDGSSAKENCCEGDNMDQSSIGGGGGGSGWKDIPLTSGDSTSKGKSTIRLGGRSPLSIRKACSNHVRKAHFSNEDDWHVEIAVPKTCPLLSADRRNEESQGSCITKASVRTKSEAKRMPDPGYIMQINDAHNPECLCISDVTGTIEAKSMKVDHKLLQNGGLNKVGICDWPIAIASCPEDQTVPQKTGERKSLDSVVTECCSPSVEACSTYHANELALIRRHLLEIENKQSNLLNILQVFMGSSMESLSALQSKVLGLESTVDKIAADLSHIGNSLYTVNTSSWIKSLSNSSSPRVSTYSCQTPQEKMFARGQSEGYKQQVELKSRPRSFFKQVQEVDLCPNPTVNVTRKPSARPAKETLACGLRRKVSYTKSSEGCHSLSSKISKGVSESYKPLDLVKDRGHTMWKHINEFLCVDDFESAFTEALCGEDESTLIKLMEITGPVLDRLSPGTANKILSIAAALLVKDMFLECLLPWLQQVVDLCTNGKSNYFMPSAKARRELLTAIQEVAAMHFADPEEKRCIAKLALKLTQLYETTDRDLNSR